MLQASRAETGVESQIIDQGSDGLADLLTVVRVDDEGSVADDLG
jgi:hypothetical protein